MRTVEECVTGHGPLTMDSLIPVLQEVQTESGYLSDRSMEEISTLVGVPASRVYGVATFTGSSGSPRSASTSFRSAAERPAM